MNSENIKKRNCLNTGIEKKLNTCPVFLKQEKVNNGEGDFFWGIRVPFQRSIARKFIQIDIESLQELIQDPVHECRLTALLILTLKYQKKNMIKKK